MEELWFLSVDAEKAWKAIRQKHRQRAGTIKKILSFFIIHISRPLPFANRTGLRFKCRKPVH